MKTCRVMLRVRGVTLGKPIKIETLLEQIRRELCVRSERAKLSPPVK
jgi:hypothetical protein